MVLYNPKEWAFAIFRITNADTFRRLLSPLLVIGIYSVGIVYLEMGYLKLGQNSYAKNITVMHTLLGFAISMLLVFRTNTAYERWWEGRKLWGSLINNSRNLAIKLNVILPASDYHSRSFFRQIIPLYAYSLRRHLLKDSTRLILDEKPHPELPDLNNHSHLPNKLADSMLKELHKLYKNRSIPEMQLLILNNEWQSFTDICGACERIKNTPIPYSYSAFIKKFIFIYVVTMPVGLAISLGWFTVPVTLFIFYVLASLELIAEEIEDPFGIDSNDLPMEKIADNIRHNVHDIIDIG